MKIRLKPYIQTILGCLFITGACAAGALIALTPQTACAQPAGGQPPTPCDPQYMDALEARAWLEAQREISQNQNLIVKPDSVLEYSCFGSFLNVVARDAVIFSETERWGSIPGMGQRSTDLALQSMVIGALVGYLETNFPHTFLGGRATADYVRPSGVNGADYACEMMSLVWNEAKCMNFFDEESFDGFYDFRWYQEQDPRRMPGGNFAACEPPSEGTFTYTNMQQIAFNQRQETYVLQDENIYDNTPYNVDSLVTFLNFILPVGVAPAATCEAPIMTGVMVSRIGQPEYPDAVCPNPGCYYTGGTGENAGQCRSGS